jgi:hypothetical protein
MGDFLTFPGSLLVVILLAVIAVGSVLIFRRRLAAAVETDSGLPIKDRIASWDVFIKAMSTAAVLIAGLMAFIKYIDQREMELVQQQMQAAENARDINVQIYGKSSDNSVAQRILFNEVTDLAATLAASDSLDAADAQIAATRFERLYWGQLVLYERGNVEMAMVDFRDALLKWKRNGRKPAELLPDERTNVGERLHEEKKNSDFVQRLALRLSSACRTELDLINKAQTNP